MMVKNYKILGVVISTVTVLLFSGCGGSSSSDSAETVDVNLNGTWVMTITEVEDSGGTEERPRDESFTIVQNGNELQITTSDTKYNASGSVYMDGDEINVSITFEDINIDGSYEEFDGIVESDSSMYGSYWGVDYEEDGTRDQERGYWSAEKR